MKNETLHQQLKNLLESQSPSISENELREKVISIITAPETSHELSNSPFKAFIDIAKDYQNEKAEPPYIKSDFLCYDNKFGGFLTNELIVIGGRPGMGKTTFLLNLCVNISAKHRVGYFSLGNSELDLYMKLTRNMKIILGDSMLSGKKMFSKETITLQDHLVIVKSNIYINVNTDFSTRSLADECRLLVKEKGVRVIFIDNIQFENTKMYISDTDILKVDIASILNNLAKELQVCIILTCQLDKLLETRIGNNRPQLKDLKTSGSLEEVADKVILMYRPDYYEIEKKEMSYEKNGLVELLIVKNKTGIANIFFKIFRRYYFTHFHERKAENNSNQNILDL